MVLKKKFDSKSIKTIGVFVGEDLMGDAILKYPFVCALRERFPEAQITWIAGHAKSAYSSFLSPLARGKLDKVLDKEKIAFSWKELLFPKVHSFDLMINTHRYFKTMLLLKRVRHKFFLDFSHKFFFSDIKPRDKNYKKPKHVTDQLIDAIGFLGKKRDLKRHWGVEISEAMKAEVSKLFSQNKTYVLLSPGAGQKKKQWDLDNFVRVAMEQIRCKRVPVFILGPMEKSWHTSLKKLVPEALFPLQDQEHFLKDPLYTVAIAEQCSCAVSNDSGTGHLLGLFQKPLISLFGPTSSAKLHPYGSEVRIIRSQEYGGDAMSLIPVEKVLEMIEVVLRGSKQ